MKNKLIPGTFRNGEKLQVINLIFFMITNLEEDIMAFTGVRTAAVTDDVGVTTANVYLFLSCRITHRDRHACGQTTTRLVYADNVYRQTDIFIIPNLYR